MRNHCRDRTEVTYSQKGVAAIMCEAETVIDIYMLSLVYPAIGIARNKVAKRGWLFHRLLDHSVELLQACKISRASTNSSSQVSFSPSFRTPDELSRKS